MLLLYLSGDVLVIMVSVVVLFRVASGVPAAYVDVFGFCECFFEPGPQVFNVVCVWYLLHLFSYEAAHPYSVSFDVVEFL